MGQNFTDKSDAVIGACIEVHRELGPGLLESIYEECVCMELRARGIAYERQVLVPVTYKGAPVPCEYRIDLIVDRKLVVEIKSVLLLLPVHEAQLLTYLRVTGAKAGLLINFNEATLRRGLQRWPSTEHPSPTRGSPHRCDHNPFRSLATACQI